MSKIKYRIKSRLKVSKSKIGFSKKENRKANGKTEQGKEIRRGTNK